MFVYHINSVNGKQGKVAKKRNSSKRGPCQRGTCSWEKKKKTKRERVVGWPAHGADNNEKDKRLSSAAY